MQISITVDIKRATAYLRGIQRTVIPQAQADGINKTSKKAKTFIKRRLAAAMGLTQKALEEGNNRKGAGRALIRTKATPARGHASIIATGLHYNLIRFKAKQTKKGVKANPWGGKKVLFPGTFIGNKGRTVFKRVRGQRAATSSKQAIAGVHGPSLPVEFNRPGFQAKLLRKINADLPVEIARAIKFRLSRLRR